VNGIGTEEGFDIILSNPSLFIRNLDAILRKHDSKAVLDLFKMSLQSRDVETKLLVQILEHFRNRNVDLTSRSFILKGKANPVVVDKSLDALRSDVIDQLNSIILEELKRQYSNGENYFAKAYIDPQLYKINIPKSLSSQDGVKIVSRGSRYKFNGDGDVIRMFVHWKANVDIDLSAILFDNGYNNVGSVNFGNLSGEYWEHSGDVRSAPNGGSEFIDFELNKLPENVRYLGMTVNCYSGQAYDDIPQLFGGFMIREDRLAGKAFDARTVEDKFSISGGQDFKLCVLFDVQTREVIMMNTAVDSGPYWSIHSMSFDKQIKAILDRKYVTVGELIELHTDYVLCEDEQLTMSQEELGKVVVFGEEYGFNVVDITSNIL
jgi:stress response protein SCP2